MVNTVPYAFRGEIEKEVGSGASRALVVARVPHVSGRCCWLLSELLSSTFPPAHFTTSYHPVIR